LPAEETARRQQLLRESVPRKGVELAWHDREVSLLEGAIARGGRSFADTIQAAWRSGARFDAWTERFDLGTWRRAAAETGVDLDEAATRTFVVGDELPWSHISTGVSEQYLIRERERALEATPTPDCSIDACTGCDACDSMGVDIVLAGERRG
jgi:hypothetical protein